MSNPIDKQPPLWVKALVFNYIITNIVGVPSQNKKKYSHKTMSGQTYHFLELFFFNYFLIQNKKH